MIKDIQKLTTILTIQLIITSVLSGILAIFFVYLGPLTVPVSLLFAAFATCAVFIIKQIQKTNVVVISTITDSDKLQNYKKILSSYIIVWLVITTVFIFSVIGTYFITIGILSTLEA